MRLLHTLDEFFHKLCLLKKDASNFLPEPVLLGISSWTSNFSDSAIEPDAFVSNWENHMGWKYCPNWVLFRGRYDKELQNPHVAWNLT